ncbi:O-methyltransferase [Lysinibacter sp. HNR]|uniref:O-methyltransferase n=1 Tax=Lysinibacter sp. HNR TaxID=3031408 RepID=UPI0024355AD5|nr:O-methyltransferase [Lysinibacter sp. HNR]WGD38373.1 O-methyltransferase [Lysinibacter sp. HNR]
MSQIENNWKYAEDLPLESPVIEKARKLSIELGVSPVSPAVGSALSSVVAMTRASTIAEIGTGLGVSGLWLLSRLDDVSLTTIDSESEYHRHARSLFTQAGIAPSRLRFINGKAEDILPRMNENSYDLVVIDANPDLLLEYVEHGLRLVRPGGTVLVPRILHGGRVADPAIRDSVSVDYRALLHELEATDEVVSALLPVGDGLLQITRL